MSKAKYPDLPEGRFNQRRKAVHGESFDPNKTENDITYVPKSTQQRMFLEEALREIFLFANLDTDQFEGALDALKERKVGADENILNYDEEGNTFFIIQKGKFQSYKKENGIEIESRCYSDRDHFGEIYLLYGEPVDSRITSLTDGILWCLDRKTYKQIVLGIRAKKLAEFDTYIQWIPTLRDLTPNEKNELVSAVQILHFKEGDQVIEQGERQNGMYVLLKGKLKFFQKMNNGDISEWIGDKNGCHFGEKSFVSRSWWPYTIIAETPSEFAYLSVEAAEASLGSLKTR